MGTLLNTRTGKAGDDRLVAARFDATVCQPDQVLHMMRAPHVPPAMSSSSGSRPCCTANRLAAARLPAPILV